MAPKCRLIAGDRTGLVNRVALNLGGILYGLSSATAPACRRRCALEMEGGKGQSLLNLFLKFEQMAGYARVQINRDRTVRGLRRIPTRSSDSTRVRISAEQPDQILSNQKVYGL